MEQNQIPRRNPKRRTPFQRNRRQQGQWLSYLLIGCVVLFLVLSLLVPDKEFSESENRSLAQRPKLSSIMEGTFLSDLGDYFADQFPARDMWMSLNLGVNKLLGQKEASGVYLCEDDYLIQVPSAPNQTQLDRNLAAVNAFAQNHPELKTVMAVVPNAVTIHADKLPENAPARDQGADLVYIRGKLTDTDFVDVTKTLQSHSEEYLFYKTDHHWTSLGAAYAFKDIAAAMGIQAPELTEYTVYPVSTTFEGTLSSKSGSHSARDTVDIYVPDSNIDYYVTYADSGEDLSSLYRREAPTTPVWTLPPPPTRSGTCWFSRIPMQTACSSSCTPTSITSP